MHLPVLYHICSSSSSRLEHIIVICKFAVEFLAYNTPIYLHPFKVRPLRVNQCCPESADKARFAATRSLRLSGNQTQEKSEAKCARPVKQGNDVAVSGCTGCQTLLCIGNEGPLFSFLFYLFNHSFSSSREEDHHRKWDR